MTTKSLGERLDEAAKQKEDAEFPETWDHSKAGNKIVGKVIRIEYGLTTAFGVGSVMEMLEDSGESKTVWMPKVLEGKIQKLGIKAGDRVGIISLGKQKGKKFDYYDFRVIKGDGDD